MGMGNRKKGRSGVMMVLRINQIKLPVEHTRAELDLAVQKRVHRNAVPNYTIVKRSLDARDSAMLRYIYSVELPDTNFHSKELSRILSDKNIMLTKKKQYCFLDMRSEWEQEKESGISRGRLSYPPVIVGTGPAGLFCGYQLAKAGYQPILIERGMPVEERIGEIEAYWSGASLNPECNVQFGEGGAGTFSDGKLNTMIKDKAGRIDEVLRTFVAFGASEDILYVNKPHIGTDVLRDVVRNMRNAILALGGQVQFNTCLSDIQIEPATADRSRDSAGAGRLTSITVRQHGILRQIPCECLILAIGHSARDTFQMLQDNGFSITPKAFAVGLRIEHDAGMIQRAQYGSSKAADSLPAADYKLTHQTPEGHL